MHLQQGVTARRQMATVGAPCVRLPPQRHGDPGSIARKATSSSFIACEAVISAIQFGVMVPGIASESGEVVLTIARQLLWSMTT